MTKLGCALWARSMNNRTESKVVNVSIDIESDDDGTVSDGTRHTTSPGTPSGSRLVTNRRNPGHSASSR